MQQNGYNRDLMDEANGVLMHVDNIAPGQQRFAQLIEQLALLMPRKDPPAENSGVDEEGKEQSKPGSASAM